MAVEREVFHELRVVHEVCEVRRRREVGESHHLLGGVDDRRLVGAGALVKLLLVVPESCESDVS